MLGELDQGALVTAQYNSTHSALSSDADLKRFLEAGNHGRPALHLVQCNVTDEKSVDEMFESAEQAIGQPVAVLVGEPSPARPPPPRRSSSTQC